MQAVEITQENWKNGIVVPGFQLPPINSFLGGELISHDAENGVIRLSFSTQPDHANPAGFVMGGITSAFLDNIPGPLTVAATGGKSVSGNARYSCHLFQASADWPARCC